MIQDLNEYSAPVTEGRARTTEGRVSPHGPAVAAGTAATRPGPARQASLRRHNLSLVLAEVTDRGPASRARIAAATGLTKASVSSLVETLIEARLLSELGPGAATGVGRPPSSLVPAAQGPVGIGLEINVDYVATCTVDLSGAVRQREVLSEDQRGAEPGTVLRRAATLARRAVDGARASGSWVAGLSVGVPGLVETDGQVLRWAPNLGWRDLPVPDALHGVDPDGLAGLPISLDNEANLAALGELWCGGQRRPDGSPLETFVHVSGEIGVGSGVVVAGRIFRGRRGFSGELGHVPVRFGGPTCRCGASGCLELVAGQEAILHAAGLGPDPAPAATGSRPRVEDRVDELVHRATAGRVQALAAIEAAGTALGTGIATLVNLLDVDAVVLGGLYARLAPWLREPIEAELARRVLAWPWAPVRVLVSGLGREAAVRGAATSVVRKVIADPGAYLNGG